MYICIIKKAHVWNSKLLCILRSACYFHPNSRRSIFQSRLKAFCVLQRPSAVFSRWTMKTRPLVSKLLYNTKLCILRELYGELLSFNIEYLLYCLWRGSACLRFCKEILTCAQSFWRFKTTSRCFVFLNS